MQRLEIDEIARRWIISYAVKNIWRVATWYELDDLIQDGYMHYYRVLKKYPHVTDRAHIMRLFQLTYMCWITDLSKEGYLGSKPSKNKLHKQSSPPQRAEVLVCDLTRPDQTQEQTWDVISPIEHECATLGTLIAQAPLTIKAVLQLFTTDKDRKGIRALNRPGASKENLNQRLCRLAGYDPDRIDLVKTVRQYFSTKPPSRRSVTLRHKAA